MLMFSTDQARIQAWCKNPDKFLRVGTMVLLSIRMQWVGVGNQMADVQVHGSKSKCLWGFKQAGYVYLRDNRKALYAATRDARAGRLSTADLMREFLKVPGLGLPKAGFLVQLLTGKSGCLDMHNVERFGLDVGVWSVRTYKDTAKQMREIDDKIAVYLALIEACGGSEKLWDDWCEHVNDRVGTFEGGEDVSRRHYIYLLDIPGEQA
jgi:hypothetical protein